MGCCRARRAGPRESLGEASVHTTQAVMLSLKSIEKWRRRQQRRQAATWEPLGGGGGEAKDQDPQGALQGQGVWVRGPCRWRASGEGRRLRVDPVLSEIWQLQRRRSSLFAHARTRFLQATHRSLTPRHLEKVSPQFELAAVVPSLAKRMTSPVCRASFQRVCSRLEHHCNSLQTPVTLQASCCSCRIFISRAARSCHAQVRSLGIRTPM